MSYVGYPYTNSHGYTGYAGCSNNYGNHDLTAVEDLTTHRRREILTTFWNSGVHGKDWHSDVFCLVTCRLHNSKSQLVSRNTLDGVHAETSMVNYLREALGQGSLDPSQHIVVYLNYSPCRHCSDMLAAFKEDDLDDHDVSLEMVVAGLYHVIRPSCRSSPDHEFHHFPSWKKHRSQVQGLQNLVQAGVGVRTVNSLGHQDWNRLAKHVLGVEGFPYKGSLRQQEDRNLSADLDEVLGYRP